MVRSVEESIKSEKEAHYIMHSIHVLNFVLFFLNFFMSKFWCKLFSNHLYLHYRYNGHRAWAKIDGEKSSPATKAQKLI